MASKYLSLTPCALPTAPCALPTAACAAFIASHNKATQDKLVFDNGSKRGGRRRGGKASQETDRMVRN